MNLQELNKSKILPKERITKLYFNVDEEEVEEWKNAGNKKQVMDEIYPHVKEILINFIKISTEASMCIDSVVKVHPYALDVIIRIIEEWGRDLYRIDSYQIDGHGMRNRFTYYLCIN